MEDEDNPGGKHTDTQRPENYNVNYTKKGDLNALTSAFLV
jgi:hypothetical protein